MKSIYIDVEFKIPLDVDIDFLFAPEDINITALLFVFVLYICVSLYLNFLLDLADGNTLPETTGANVKTAQARWVAGPRKPSSLVLIFESWPNHIYFNEKTVLTL